MIVGYGSNSNDAEAWTIELYDPKTRPVPNKIAGVDDCGWMAFAQVNAIDRLFNGYDDDLAQALASKIGGTNLTAMLTGQHRLPAPAAMPFMDAISPPATWLT